MDNEAVSVAMSRLNIISLILCLQASAVERPHYAVGSGATERSKVGQEGTIRSTGTGRG